MLRICGAAMERDALSRARCWCGGLFCGRGGARLSTQFRRTFHLTATASSLRQFEDLIGQADLFDVDARRQEWADRVAASLSARRRRAS